MMKSMKNRAVDEDISLILSKKRKFCSDELENGECCGELSDNFASPAASRASRCCSRTFQKHDDDESRDVVKSLRSPDVENVVSESKRFEPENSTYIVGGVFRESTPDEVLSMHSSSSSSSSKKISPTTAPPGRKVTPAQELEAFFAVAEKCEQKRFAEKYNYDIVKDVPLEGKYHWVRLHP